jgi:mRNA interferase RelE/StbE
MARWELVIERRAQKALARIEKRDRDRIAKAIRALAQEPRSPGAKKLAGRDVYRVRVGDYRVL